MAVNTERSTVVGVFHHRNEAERAVDELRRNGFSDNQVGIATRDDGTSTGENIHETGSKAGEGAATGAVVGGLLGAAAALLIPGLGPILAGGILATALGGAAVGAAAGGLLGALVGMGIPEDEARYYEGEFNEGRTIVTVKADGRYNEARAVLQRHGAYDVESQPGTATRTTTGRAATAGMAAPAATEVGEVRTSERPVVGRESRVEREEVGRERDRRPTGEKSVELREEELRAVKRPVEAGEARIRKDVVEEERTMDVPVTREEVVVDRRPVDRRVSDRPLAEGETIKVPVRKEEVDVEKQAVVTEEVEVGKREVRDTERVSDTVRREELKVDREGDVDVRDDRPRR